MRVAGALGCEHCKLGGGHGYFSTATNMGARRELNRVKVEGTMTTKTDFYRLVDIEVERRFKENPPLYGEECTNPVTGDRYIGGVEPVEPQKQAARGALLARAVFAIRGPADAPPLPVDNWDKVKYKDAMNHLVAQFCVSLKAHLWDLGSHPGFELYARGVMASPYAADIVRKDDAMRRRYPPQVLNYIRPGMIWYPEPE